MNRQKSFTSGLWTQANKLKEDETRAMNIDQNVSGVKMFTHVTPYLNTLKHIEVEHKRRAMSPKTIRESRNTSMSKLFPNDTTLDDRKMMRIFSKGKGNFTIHEVLNESPKRKIKSKQGQRIKRLLSPRLRDGYVTGPSVVIKNSGRIIKDEHSKRELDKSHGKLSSKDASPTSQATQGVVSKSEVV